MFGYTQVDVVQLPVSGEVLERVIAEGKRKAVSELSQHIKDGVPTTVRSDTIVEPHHGGYSGPPSLRITTKTIVNPTTDGGFPLKYGKPFDSRNY